LDRPALPRKLLAPESPPFPGRQLHDTHGSYLYNVTRPFAVRPAPVAGALFGPACYWTEAARRGASVKHPAARPGDTSQGHETREGRWSECEHARAGQAERCAEGSFEASSDGPIEPVPEPGDLDLYLLHVRVELQCRLESFQCRTRFLQAFEAQT